MPRSPLSTRVAQYRMALLISIAIVLPLGYLVRFSQGPAPEWFNDAFGSIAYEFFWLFLVLLLFPKASPFWVAIGVFLVTCAIEFLQLCQLQPLPALRANFVGRLVLGNTFNWPDFPAYFVGCALGWRWVELLNHLFFNKRHT
jgi:hypothetical protein